MCYVLCPCVMELLAKPKKDKNVFIENRYKPILTNYPNLSIVDMEYNIADIASRLRANYNIITFTLIYIHNRKKGTLKFQ